MNLKNYFLGFCNRKAETVAAFGQAKLIKTSDGKLELRGGTKDDIIAAREWISLFMHDEVIRENLGSAVP